MKIVRDIPRLFLSFRESDPASRNEADVRPARERQSQVRVGGVDWFGDEE
jgi:hypothetical protein